MAPRYRKVDSLLHSIQDATARHHTNAYQITKSTGLPLRSVQKLLQQASNPTLRNIEIILSGFGLALFLKEGGRKTIGKGRRPGKPRAAAARPAT